MSGVYARPMTVLIRSGALELGAENVLPTFREEAVRAWELAGPFPAGAP